MNRSVALVATASLAVGSLWALHRRGADAPAEDDAATARILSDRVWIDHQPRSDKDTVQVFFLLSKQAHGLFQATSVWKGQYEVFGYELQGADLRIVYPQTNERERTTARARRCNEGGMDFCLEIQGGSRGAKKYYSREGWEIEAATTDAARALVEQRLASLTR